MRTWSWSANSIEPGRTARMCWPGSRLISIGFGRIRLTRSTVIISQLRTYNFSLYYSQQFRNTSIYNMSSLSMYKADDIHTDIHVYSHYDTYARTKRSDNSCTMNIHGRWLVQYIKESRVYEIHFEFSLIIL